MLDLHFIRENPDLIRNAIRVKNIPLDLNKVLELDERIRTERLALNELERKRNENAAAVPRAMPDDRERFIELGRDLSRQIQARKEMLASLNAKLEPLLLLVPNIPATETPVGDSDKDNVEVRRVGDPPNFNFKPSDHVELLAKNGWAEFERAAKASGTRSYALRGDAVILEMALWRFALDFLQTRGFVPLTVPALARAHAFVGTGHFPSAREQTYAIPEDDLFLAGTGEVSVNALHGGEILQEDQLPLKYAALSPCFRREAGSSGKDTRGLIRVHQFWKVEQYVLCRNDPSESKRLHEDLLRNGEEILQALELPYRVLDVCTGDMGPGKVRQHDLEAYVPSEGRYRETHSCSSLHDWQARRTNLRYRGTDGRVRFCHTLNNTGIATPRILVPLLEIHQRAEGSVQIPRALRPLMNGAEFLKPSR